jgi:RNA polymerase sigma factor (sigma-70 family)
MATDCVVVPTSDAVLLNRYVHQRDGQAFAALVRRHGPMVYGVCRRLLYEHQAAEDACQAAFLVLARRAASVQPPDRLAAFLHGVACRVARKARSTRAHRSKEGPLLGVDLADERQDPLAEVSARELLTAVDEEVRRLPEVYRVAVVLCCLEGKTQEEAARLLGWTPGSLQGRLERGRKRLHARLARRGLTLGAALAAVEVSRCTAPAGLSAVRTTATVRAALGFAAGQGVEGAAVSARVWTLAQEGVKGVAAARTSIVFAVLLAMGMAAAGVVSVAFQAPSSRPPESNPGVAAVQPRPQEEKPQTRLDRYGDPLPPGAVTRLVTIRWRLDPFGVAHMVVSGDGRALVSINPVRGISIVDMASGKLMRSTPRGPARPAAWLDRSRSWERCALSADGHTAAFGGRDSTIYVIDVDTGKERQRCVSPRGEPLEIALSGNGLVLAARLDDQTLLAWDVASGKEILQLPTKTQRQQEPRVKLALSADGKTLAWVEEDAERSIHVYDLAGGRQRPRLLQHKGEDRTIAISPDGKTLFAAGETGPAQLWDLQTGRLVHSVTYEIHPWPPDAAFAPDGKTLGMLINGNELRLLEVATGKELWRSKRSFTNRMESAFAFTRDGKTLILSERGGHILERYHMATGERVLSPGEKDSGFEDVAFAADNRGLYTQRFDTLLHQRSLTSWDAASGEKMGQTDFNNTWGHSPDFATCLVGWQPTRVCRTATGQELARLAIHPDDFPTVSSFSPDGMVVAVAARLDKKENVVLFSAATGKELRRIASPAEGIHHLEFSADGQTLIGRGNPTGGNFRRHSCSALFWDVATGQQLRTLSLPEGNYIGPGHPQAVSPDAKTLADHSGGNIHFFEVLTGEERLSLPPPSFMPCPMLFSADGSLFLVGDLDGSVRFFDAHGGRLLLRLEGHRGRVRAITFAPDGRRFATLSDDDTVLVWDLAEVLRKMDRPKPAALTPEGLRSAWADLADLDATKAYQAIGTMAAAPEQAVAWLREHLRAVRPAEPRRLLRLLADLDKDEFVTRERASAELAKIGEAAGPELRKALAGKPSPEFRRRAEQLLQDIDGERLRTCRAVEVLEQIGRPDSEAVIAVMSEGMPQAQLTREAQVALQRLRKRSGVAP